MYYLKFGEIGDVCNEEGKTIFFLSKKSAKRCKAYLIANDKNLDLRVSKASQFAINFYGATSRNVK